MNRVRPTLYQRGKVYYYRDQTGGRDKWVSLRTSSRKKALDLLDEINRHKTLERLGIETSKPAPNKFRFISDVLGFYMGRGCPKADGSARPKAGARIQKRLVSEMLPQLGDVRVGEFDASVWNDYCDRQHLAGVGNSTLDHQIIALKVAFKTCSQYPRETGITEPPKFSWAIKRRKTESINHCREFQPENAEELHKIARISFDRHPELWGPGWVILFQAMVGQRIQEILKFRMDAASTKDPGFDDGENLWLYRSKTHKGTAQFARIHPALRQLMDAHKIWHSANFPGNPWYFASQKGQNAGIKSRGARGLLDDYRKATGKRRTTHGMRSYYVNVLRSQGLPDGEIALRIGHKSGGRLLVEVYGEVMPTKLDWMPENAKPAWE